VFQDSATALNPRFSAVEIVEEPLVIQKQGAAKERRERALDLMRQVGLLPEWAHRRPLEFSGGQRQRLAIARALAVRPRFMIFDEALSGLDLSIQGQIVNLLLDLQAAYALTYLFISHDLGLIARFCDRVAVMHQGKIVEEAEPATLWKDAQHAHTRALMASLAFLQSAHAAASR
jgi:ABC-type dipeptide/oligopeptide/nickel transport system ATPase subunit